MKPKISAGAEPRTASFAALDWARHNSAPGMRRVMAWQIARTVLRLGFSAAAAIAIGEAIMGELPSVAVVAVLPPLIAAIAIAGVCAERCLASVELKVSTGLRERAAAHLRDADAPTLRALPVGTLTIALQRHPPAVAALVVGHRAATLMMGVGPLLAAAALVAVSWQAAALMLILTPLMIVFFALVGDAIRRRADAQERSFGRLAGQFADRIRTLPTILANDALAPERDKLAARLRDYARNTMAVLRIAFVNAAIIDFFASLSIAMLAVFLGLGHLGLAEIPGFSHLALWQSLFILMIAPDYFAPFRRFSEQYHAKAEGVAAVAALDRLMENRDRAAPPITAVEQALRNFTLPDSGLVAVTGPSGAGKSTFLRRVAGIEGQGGTFPIDQAFSFISTDAPVMGATVGEAISWGWKVPTASILLAAGQVGLLNELQLPGGLNARVGPGGSELSGGQRLRISVARALLSDRPVLADEPTAKLDARNAATVRTLLKDISRKRPVIVATHDTGLAALAIRTVVIGADPRVGSQA